MFMAVNCVDVQYFKFSSVITDSSVVGILHYHCLVLNNWIVCTVLWVLCNFLFSMLWCWLVKCCQLDLRGKSKFSYLNIFRNALIVLSWIYFWWWLKTLTCYMLHMLPPQFQPTPSPCCLKHLVLGEVPTCPNGVAVLKLNILMSCRLWAMRFDF